MSKRIFTLFIGLAVITVLLVLNSVVFVVKTVEVEFETPQNFDEGSTIEQDIITASGITVGKNIFVIRESIVKNNIEQATSDIEVIQIERFPNKVVLYVARRVPVLAIPIASGNATKYVIADSVMTVLKVLDSATEEDLAPYVYVDHTPLAGGTVTVGQTLDTSFGNIVSRIQNVTIAFQYAGLSPEGFATFIDDIRVTDTYLTLTTSDGLEVYIDLTQNRKVDGRIYTSEEIYNQAYDFYIWYLDNGEPSSGRVEYDSNAHTFVLYESLLQAK